jgi:hypothetical protein
MAQTVDNPKCSDERCQKKCNAKIKMAELKRFELLNGFHHYTLSKRAPSTTRTQLRIEQDKENYKILIT